MRFNFDKIIFTLRGERQGVYMFLRLKISQTRNLKRIYKNILSGYISGKNILRDLSCEKITLYSNQRAMTHPIYVGHKHKRIQKWIALLMTCLHTKEEILLERI